MYRTTLTVCSLVFLSCATAPTAQSADVAHNTRSPAELVRAHLRAIEAGDWATAEAQLDPSFTMQLKGMPVFVKIPFADALAMHKARKRAFPDFTFNEQVAEPVGNSVKVSIFLKGTHTGFLDYPIKEVPKLEATGKPIDLPAEYFTYFFENDRITRVYGEIPEGHGPPALKKQLGVE
jgi:hypothetical protein